MVITLNSDTPSIQYLCKKDKRLAKVISMVGPITYELHSDPYDFLVHEIIEQMLSVKAGNKIYSRLVDLCDGSITPEKVTALSDAEIKSIGTATSKVNFIRNLTTTVMNNEINFSSLETLSDGEVFHELTKLKGIGKWTANMYLIFVLNRLDILPTNDVAFLQAYQWLYKTDDRTEKTVLKKCKKWKPYSSIASRYLYRALDGGFTREEFHLYKNKEE